MPKRIERRIVREYRRKGYSLARSKRIAYATMNKLGLLKRTRKAKRKVRRR